MKKNMKRARDQLIEKALEEALKKEIEEEIREKLTYKELIKRLAQGDADAYMSALDKELLPEALTYLCKGNCTGDLRTDIVMGAYYANVEAHEDNFKFYYIKSRLLEYIFEHKLWGIEPYNSFGIGKDSYGNDVAYFDVPNCGQVSFHLIDTYYDISQIPCYKLNWCGTINKEFPSYESIKNLHNLLIALGYDNYDSLGNAIKAVNPINFFKIANDEKKVAYYAGLNEFYKRMGSYDDNLIASIILKKIVFSKEDGIISEEYIEEIDQKIEILKKYPYFDKSVSDFLRCNGVIEDEKISPTKAAENALQRTTKSLSNEVLYNEVLSGKTKDNVSELNQQNINEGGTKDNE